MNGLFGEINFTFKIILIDLNYLIVKNINIFNLKKV